MKIKTFLKQQTKKQYYLFFISKAPNLFETVLSLVKPVLDKNTRDSLMVYGKNPGEWGPIIKAAVDPKYLPKRYGGQKEDPN